MQQAVAQQNKPGTPVHLLLQRLQPITVALCLPVAPSLRRCNASYCSCGRMEIERRGCFAVDRVQLARRGHGPQSDGENRIWMLSLPRLSIRGIHSTLAFPLRQVARCRPCLSVRVVTRASRQGA